MLLVIWGVLNLTILLSLIFYFLRSIKKRSKSSFLFSLFLILVVLINNEYEKKNTEIKPFTFQKIDPNNAVRNEHFKTIYLEKNLASQIEVHFKYFSSISEFKILEATSSRTGFASGINWKVKNIAVADSNKNQVKFSLLGVLEWKILGITLYSQEKRFDGETLLDS